MKLDYGTPDSDLLRELSQVKAAAAAVVKSLAETNALPLDFPRDVLEDVCEALAGLEAGTAENCRPTLEYARNKIPEIRREYFHFDDDEWTPALGIDEPRLYRGMPLDTRLNGLIGSVTTALDEYRVQAQERFDDEVRADDTVVLRHPEETTGASADATRAIESADRALTEIVAKGLNETEKGDVLARRLADGKNLATAARSQIRARKIVKRWFEGISSALRQLPDLIGKAGRAIKIGSDVADVLSDWWSKTEHELLKAAIEQIREFGGALEQISDALRHRSPTQSGLSLNKETLRTSDVLNAEAEVESLMKAGKEVPIKLAELVRILNISGSEFRRNEIPRWKDIVRCRNLVSLYALHTDFAIRRHGHLLGAMSDLNHASIPEQGQDDIDAIDDLKELTALTIPTYDVSSIEALKSLTKLARLKLYIDEVRDISPLATMSRLEGLTLSAASLEDVSPLSALSNLSYLILIAERLRDAGPLSKLGRLSSLTIQSASLQNIDSFDKLTGLQSLKLQAAPLVHIDQVGALKSLKALSLQVNKVRDLSPLKSLSNLTSLALEANRALSVSSLASLKNLDTLSLQVNMAKDLEILGSLAELTSLRLAAGQATDLSCLGTLEKLTLLSLQANKIIDIGFVGNLRSLTALALQSTGVREGFGSIARLQNLVRLDVNGVEWNWIGYLNELHSLEYLTLSGKGIVDASSLAKIRNLRSLHINSLEVLNPHHLGDIEFVHSH